MAEVSVRSRGKGDVDALLANDYVREPLRRHDIPPITDGAAAMVLATGDRARAARRAAGLHHRLRPPHRVPQPVVPGARRLAVDPHRRRGRRSRPTARSRSPSCRPRSPTRSCCCATCSASATTCAVNPSGGALKANPIMATGLCRIGYAADHIFGGGARALAHSTVGPVPATEPDLHPGGAIVSHDPLRRRRGRPDPPQVAPPRRVVRRPRPRGRVPGPRRRPHDDGRHRRRRARQGPRPVRGRDEARAVPVRRARRGRASRCSGCTPPARSAAPPASSPRRTCRRASTRRVLAVAFEKQSEGNAQFALGSGKGASLGAGGAFAPFIRAYIHRSGAPEHIGWKVAVKDRLNALEEPVRPPEDRGHLDREGEGVPDDVGADPLPRVVPVVRRRLRGGAHRRGRRQGGRGRRPTAGVDPRRVVTVASRRASPAATRCAPRPACRAPTTSTSRPASPTRASRSTWPSCTCRSRGTRRSGSRPTASPSRARAGR